MGLKNLERHIGSIPYAAGQTRTIELPRNYWYRKLYLALTATGVFRGAGSGSENPKDSSPAQLISNISVRANGRDVIKSIDFAALHRASQARHGTRPFIQIPDVWDGDSAIVEGSAIEMSIAAVLDFEMWRAVRPADTFFNSRRLTTLELIVTWANPNALMGDDYGDDVTIGDATLQIDSFEAIGEAERIGMMVNKENRWRYPVDVSGDHNIRIPTGNIFREFMIRTTDANGYPVNDLIGSILLKSGTEVFKVCSAERLQMINRIDFGLESPIGNDAQDRSQYESVVPGHYWMDFPKDGRLTECLDTSQMGDMELVVNVSGTGTTEGVIDIYPTELIMPPSQPAQTQ